MTFTHDYSKCMMMKLKMADPDRKGGSCVHCDCEKALEIIRQADNLTLGVKKIIYLVGWQYNGHDDKYPAFFQVNEGIKRKSDATARDSLLWLIEEAKKYNTVVSVHVNFTDAYEDSPLFADYVREGALIRTASGKPAKIEKYNGKPCYKISYKEEWESGLFKKRVDELLRVLPIEAAGTVHVDNFQCYVNRKPFVGAEEMQAYRLKMIEYLAAKGVDITSEFTYREGKGTVLMYGRITRDVTPTRYPIALLGHIPAVWWVDKMTMSEYFDYYPGSYCGGLPKNKRIRAMLYGNIHGEELWLKEDWQADFVRQFYTVNVPFFHLARKKKHSYGKGKNEVIFDDGTVSRRDGTITENGVAVKTAHFVFLPFADGYVYYGDGTVKFVQALESHTMKIYEITTEGRVYIGKTRVLNGEIGFSLKEYTPYFFEFAREYEA